MSTSRSTVPVRRSARRTAGRIAACAAVAFAAVGCVQVNGSTARIAGLNHDQAEAVVAAYDKGEGQALVKRDPKLDALVETGALGVTNQAGLRILSSTDPRDASPAQPYTHPKPQLLIPRTAGWPKWFAAVSTPTYQGSSETLLIFTKESPGAPWLAAWEPAVLDNGKLPEFAHDKNGDIVAAPVEAGAGLAAAPRQVGQDLVTYLSAPGGGQGAQGVRFADGPYTSVARQQQQNVVNPGYVRQAIDNVAPEFPPLGIKLKNGGVLVIFALQQSTKITVQPPNTVGDVDASTMTFLSAKPTKSLTQHRLAQYAAVIPPRKGGEITVVAEQSGLVGAEGQ